MLQYRVSDPVFFLEHKGEKRVFLSNLELDAFREVGNSDVEAVDVGLLADRAAQKTGDRTANLALTILETYGVTEPVSVPANFPVALADTIRKNTTQLTAVQHWAPERIRKSPTEISSIKENFVHTTKAYEYIEQVLRESVIEGDVLLYNGTELTSEFLRREVSKILLEYDLISPEGLIISCGAHAAMPHHSGAGPIRPHKTVIVDIFPQSTANHYFADMTRTYVKGEPSESVQKMYEAVREAKRASLAALKPGISTQSVYEISADVIRKRGFDVGEKGYIHSLGHGLGIEVHELPTMSPRSDAVLESGNVVTIEPGLYYPEYGGIRIEDTVVITEDGYENLTNYPQKWHIS